MRLPSWKAGSLRWYHRLGEMDETTPQDSADPRDAPTRRSRRAGTIDGRRNVVRLRDRDVRVRRENEGVAEDAGVRESGARHPSVLSEDDLEIRGSVGLRIDTSLRETIPNGALATFEVVRVRPGANERALVARISASWLRIYVRAWPETEEEYTVVSAAIQKAWRLHRKLAASPHKPHGPPPGRTGER